VRIVRLDCVRYSRMSPVEDPLDCARDTPSTALGTGPLFVSFAAPSTLLREADRRSDLRIVGNGPPGTFVHFPHGLRVSLPTDQIVCASDESGFARVAFGGMRFVGVNEKTLTFVREREVLPADQLSPTRSHVMHLDASWVTAVDRGGLTLWPAACSSLTGITHC
jgi:hypothetical protein